jgi:uncharacterized membrane protein
MNSYLLLALAFGIGIVAGLRALTGPAVICWMAHLGVINLEGSRLSFMSTLAAVAVFTVLAVVELVNDKLPKTPARTAAVSVGARLVMGILAASALGMAGSVSVPRSAILGCLGAVVGTYGGYFARTGAVKALDAPDYVIALVEDALAIGGAIFLVSRL